MVLDRPDWSREASGAQRYLGTITTPAGGQNSAVYPIRPNERSLLFVPVSVPNGGCWAQAFGLTSADVSPTCYWGVAGGVSNVAPASVVCSADLDTSYRVTVNSLAPGFVAIVAVYASTDPPSISNPGTPTAVVFTDGQSLLIGQQPQSQSLPVVPTSSLPIGTAGLKPSSASLPVVVTDSQAAGKTGPNTSANALPVTMASDQLVSSGVPDAHHFTGHTASVQSLAATGAVFGLQAGASVAYLKRVRVSLVGVTTAGTLVLDLRRTTAVGTSTLQTVGAFDGASTPLTTPRAAYSVQPTLGARLGVKSLPVAAAQPVTAPGYVEWVFGDERVPGIAVLASQAVVVNVATAVTGATAVCEWEWYE